MGLTSFELGNALFCDVHGAPEASRVGFGLWPNRHNNERIAEAPVQSAPWTPPGTRSELAQTSRRATNRALMRERQVGAQQGELLHCTDHCGLFTGGERRKLLVNELVIANLPHGHIITRL
jgi:hypothetical protein